jgi:N-acyl-D-aspartate/D-glutamate deacylase
MVGVPCEAAAILEVVLRAFDVVIRGGQVVDGTGRAPFVADVALRDGVIAAVGDVAGSGAEELDARGQIVTPGFVDVHTHYDGQATWDERMQPSSLHGVTTVVMGNCGVGFAPCRPEDHERLIRLMEGVEDIPLPVLAQGLPWTWEHFPDYLNSLQTRSFDVDIGAQLPHAALRVYVMGERGANREPATAEDITAMAALARSAVEAGALGFTTSRTLNHRTSDGQPTPTLNASEQELTGIALGLAEARSGVLQFVSDFAEPQAEFDMLRRIAARSGRPLSFSLTQHARVPEQWKHMLAWLSDANQQGLEMRAQVCGRPVGILLGLELTIHPFVTHPSYREIAKRPLAERVRALSDPQLSARLSSEAPTAQRGLVAQINRSWEQLFLMHERPDYEQPSTRSLAVLAAVSGTTPAALALEHMLRDGGRGMLYLPFLNYADGSLEPSYEMLQHPYAMPGLSDGGAHVGVICDGSFPTSNLTHWTRDRTRGAKLSLQHMVRMQTRVTASALGLLDRGLIKPGYRADLNVIDYDKLELLAPEVQYDLPAGGRRLMQRARGYTATLVAGQITYRDGEPTGALPGRLVRGSQREPSAVVSL